MLWFQTSWTSARLPAVKLRALAFLLGSACSLASFFCGTSEAFERWEKPLGWNPQYGPRYVVFWGGPADYRDPSLGTCTYSHYATIPVPTEPPLSPFEDFQIAKMYELAKPKVIAPFLNDPELAKLTRLPFFEVPAVARYGQVEENQLPFSHVQNVPKVVEAAKAIVSEICVQFLRRVKNASGLSNLDAAKVEAETAQIHVAVLGVYDAIRKASEPESDQRDADIYAKLDRTFKPILRNKRWDSAAFAYWLDASNAYTEDGGGYYIPELEASIWKSAVAALTFVPPAHDNPYAQLLSTNASFRECDHFLFSRAFDKIAGKELLCQDAFYALTSEFRKAADSVTAMASPRGKKLLESAGERLGAELAHAGKKIKPESPFYGLAAPQPEAST